MSGASVSSYGGDSEANSHASGLRPAHAPGDEEGVFEETHTIQLGVFGVLYTVSKEKQLTSLKFAFFRLFLDFLQLWLLVVNPAYGWSIDAKNKAWEVVSFIQLNAFLSARGYTTFLVLLYVFVGLLAFNLAISIWVAYSFSNNRFEYVWPIQFLRWFGLIFYQVLDIATLTLLLVTLDCNYFGVPESIRFHNQEFPDVKCWSMPHIVHVAVSVVSIVVFFVMATCMVLSEMELNPLSKNYMAIAHTRVEGWGFVVKAIVTVASVMISSSIKWLSVVYLINFIILVYMTFKWVPFIFSMPNYVRCASYACVLYCSVLLAVMAFVGDGKSPEAREEFQDSVTLAMWIGMAPAALVGALACHLRLRHFNTYVLQQFRDAEPGTKSKSIYKFEDAREVEIAARCCRKWLDEDTPDPAAVAQSEVVVKAGMTQLPSDPYMIIVYSSFLIDVQGSYQSGYTQLQTAKKQNPGLLETFAIFSREQEHTQKASGANGGGGDNTVDLVAYVEFQRNHRLVVRAHREALIAMRAFWGLLLRSQVNFNHLSRALNRIETTVKVAERAYRSVVARHGSSARLVRLYGKFLETVKFDPWAASKWYTEADRLEEEAEYTKEALQLGGAETKLPGGGTVSDMDGVAVICINAQGTITMASPEAHTILGYAKNELKGKDVGIIMPPPFGDRHTAYVRNHIQTGVAQVLDKPQELIAISKTRQVVPIRTHISKISGLNEDSVFLAVLEIVPMLPNEARAWVLGNGTVVAADGRFLDWLGYEATDLVGSPIENAAQEGDLLRDMIKNITNLQQPPPNLPSAKTRPDPTRRGHRRSSAANEPSVYAGGAYGTAAAGLPTQPSPLPGGEKLSGFGGLGDKLSLLGAVVTGGGGGAEKRSSVAGGGVGAHAVLRSVDSFSPGHNLGSPGLAGLPYGAAVTGVPGLPAMQHASLPRTVWKHRYCDPLPFDTTIQAGAFGSVKVHTVVLRRCVPGPSAGPSLLPRYRDMLLVADHKGRIQHATAALAAALGRTPEALRAGGVETLIPEPFQLLHGPWLAELSNPQSIHPVAQRPPPRHSCRSGVPVSLAAFSEQQGPVVKPFLMQVEQRLALGGGSKIHILALEELALDQALADRRLRLTLDLNGTVVAAADAPADLFGVAPSALHGTSIAKLVDLFKADALNAAEQQQQQQYQYPYRNNGGAGSAFGSAILKPSPSLGVLHGADEEDDAELIARELDGGGSAGVGVGGVGGGGTSVAAKAPPHLKVARALLELARRTSETPGSSWRVGVTAPPDARAEAELEELARVLGPDDTAAAAELMGSKVVPAVMVVRLVRKSRAAWAEEQQQPQQAQPQQAQQQFPQAPRHLQQQQQQYPRQSGGVVSGVSSPVPDAGWQGGLAFPAPPPMMHSPLGVSIGAAVGAGGNGNNNNVARKASSAVAEGSEIQPAGPSFSIGSGSGRDGRGPGPVGEGTEAPILDLAASDLADLAELEALIKSANSGTTRPAAAAAAAAAAATAPPPAAAAPPAPAAAPPSAAPAAAPVPQLPTAPAAAGVAALVAAVAAAGGGSARGVRPSGAKSHRAGASMEGAAMAAVADAAQRPPVAIPPALAATLAAQPSGSFAARGASQSAVVDSPRSSPSVVAAAASLPNGGSGSGSRANLTPPPPAVGAPAAAVVASPRGDQLLLPAAPPPPPAPAPIAAAAAAAAPVPAPAVPAVQPPPPPAQPASIGRSPLGRPPPEQRVGTPQGGAGGGIPKGISLRLPPNATAAAAAAAAASEDGSVHGGAGGAGSGGDAGRVSAAEVPPPQPGPGLFIEVELWRADLLYGVLEVDEKGRVLRADATCPLGQTELVLGAPVRSLYGALLADALPLPGGGVEALFSGAPAPGADGAAAAAAAASEPAQRSAMKRRGHGKRKVGDPLVLQARHRADCCGLDLRIQAVRRAGPVGCAYILIHPHKPEPVQPGFARWLYNGDTSGLMPAQQRRQALPALPSGGTQPGAADLLESELGGGGGGVLQNQRNTTGGGYSSKSLQPSKSPLLDSSPSGRALSPFLTSQSTAAAGGPAPPPPPPPAPPIVTPLAMGDAPVTSLRAGALRNAAAAAAAAAAFGGAGAAAVMGAPSRLATATLPHTVEAGADAPTPDPASTPPADADADAAAAAAPAAGVSTGGGSSGSEQALLGAVPSGVLDSAYDPNQRPTDNGLAGGSIMGSGARRISPDLDLGPHVGVGSPRQTAGLTQGDADKEDASWRGRGAGRGVEKNSKHSMVASWVLAGGDGGAADLADGERAGGDGMDGHTDLATDSDKDSGEGDRLSAGEGAGAKAGAKAKEGGGGGVGGVPSSEGEGGTATDVESEAGAHVANYGAGKRFKKLTKILMSPQALQPARMLRMHALILTGIMLAAHTVTFVLLLTALQQQRSAVEDLNSATMASRRVHEISINGRVLASLYNGNTYVEGIPAFGEDLDVAIADLYDDTYRVMTSLKELHHGVYLGFRTLRRIPTDFGLRDIWDAPRLNISIFYDENDPDAPQRVVPGGSDNMTVTYSMMGLWDAGNMFLSKTLDMYNNGPNIVEQGINFTTWSTWRFLSANGIPVLFYAYMDTLDAMVQLTVSKSTNIYELQLIILCLEGAFLCVMACVYMWWIAARFSNRRHALYNVFIQIPIGVTRGLANMSLRLEANEEDEEEVGAVMEAEPPARLEGELTDAAVKHAAADRKGVRMDVDAAGAGGKRSFTFLSGNGNGSVHGSGELEGGGDSATGRSRSLAALGSMVGSMAFWRSRAKVAPLSAKTKRVLLPSRRVCYALAAPFIVWGIVIVIVNALGYTTLQGMSAPIATLNVVNVVLIRFHRILYYAIEVAAALNTLIVPYFKSHLHEELLLWRADVACMMYGNEVVPVLNQLYPDIDLNLPYYHLATTGVVFGGSDRPSNLLFHRDNCLCTEEPDMCQLEESPYYEVTHNGLDVLLKAQFSTVESLLAQVPDASGLNSTEFRFLWSTCQTDLECGLSSMNEVYLGDVLSSYKSVEVQQIVMFALAWVLTLLFLAIQLRPFLRQAHHEMRRIAELLSQLPNEVDVEGMLLRVVMGNTASKAGGKGGRTSDPGGKRRGANGS